MHLEKDLSTHCAGRWITGDALVGVFQYLGHFEKTVEVRRYVHLAGSREYTYVVHGPGEIICVLGLKRRGHVLVAGGALLVERNWMAWPA